MRIGVRIPVLRRDEYWIRLFFFTALHWAAKHGNLDVIKLMAGTHKLDSNARTALKAFQLRLAPCIHSKVEIPNNCAGTVVFRELETKEVWAVRRKGNMPSPVGCPHDANQDPRGLTPAGSISI
ncbi:hypothetical protein CEXT_580131 [Caerostris extrusa]|uniref:Uncharacterized protein n=1 Tax=Caerostris extrusa TaxID=172846 RepID=A0AAV4RCF7_CAEEX|nr:hypothetical protein CEXT_580131 [Caerostris extrusa]